MIRGCSICCTPSWTAGKVGVKSDRLTILVGAAKYDHTLRALAGSYASHTRQLESTNNCIVGAPRALA